MYDDLMSVVPYRAWVDYVEAQWARRGSHPTRILDLACGTGSVLRELLLRGYEVEGADVSEPMLRVARRNLPEGVRLHHSDMRSLEIPGERFDACVCLFDSLNYILDLDELSAAFRGIRRHLQPDALLVFDMNAIRALETGMFTQSGTGRDSGLEFDWRSAWEPHTRLCTIRMEFRMAIEGGERVFHETHLQKGYTEPEIRDALASGGFSDVEVFDGFSFKPPGRRTDRLHVVAGAGEAP